MVLGGELEAALVTRPIPLDELFVQNVCEERVYVCLRRDDPLAQRDELPREVIGDRLRVLFDRLQQPMLYDKLVRKFAKIDVALHPSEFASSPAEMHFLVARGKSMGIALESTEIPESLVKKSVAGLPLKIVTAFTRALQARSLFDTQQFATAVYQSELTFRLRNLGYEIQAGRSGAPEIKGYTQEYLDASSPRSQQIRDYLERTGFQGPEAAQIAAHGTRDGKKVHSTGEVMAAHYKVAAAHGDQTAKVVAEARDRQQTQAARLPKTPRRKHSRQ